MSKNRRYTDWEINSNLEKEELEKVKDTAGQLFTIIKHNKLSHYQALQALEFAKAVINEQII